MRACDFRCGYPRVRSETTGVPRDFDFQREDREDLAENRGAGVGQVSDLTQGYTQRNRIRTPTKNHRTIPRGCFAYRLRYEQRSAQWAPQGGRGSANRRLFNEVCFLPGRLAAPAIQHGLRRITLTHEGLRSGITSVACVIFAAGVLVSGRRPDLPQPPRSCAAAYAASVRMLAMRR
jgi:hypothetical protein